MTALLLLRRAILGEVVVIQLLLFFEPLVAPPNAVASTVRWKPDPANGCWTAPRNWHHRFVPHTLGDIALFGESSQTTISFSRSITVGGAIFEPVASAYTFMIDPGLSLTFAKAGVITSSGIEQSFAATTDDAGNFGLTTFSNDASTGENCVFTTEAGKFNGTSGSYRNRPAQC